MFIAQLAIIVAASLTLVFVANRFYGTFSPRRVIYVLPLFVPLSLMLARPISGWRWLTDRRLVVVGASAMVALIALKGVAGHVHTDRDSRSMARASVA